MLKRKCTFGAMMVLSALVMATATSAQTVTVYRPAVNYPVAVPTVTYYQPVVATTPVTTMYAPATSYSSSAPVITNYAPSAPVITNYAPSAPVITNYAPSAPVTTSYLPATSVTAYYAPAVAPVATTTVLAPVVPVAYRGQVWEYDPTRLLPARRWRLVSP